MAELRSEGHDFAFCNMSGQSGPEYLEATLLSGAQFIQFPHQGVNAEFVERAHAGGLIVNVFYADEPEEMKRLIDYGVDYILTNHPERLGNLIVGLSA